MLQQLQVIYHFIYYWYLFNIYGEIFIVLLFLFVKQFVNLWVVTSCVVAADWNPKIDLIYFQYQMRVKGKRTLLCLPLSLNAGKDDRGLK